MKQTPRIEVRARPVDLAPSFRSDEPPMILAQQDVPVVYCHLFLIFIDENGKEYILRGGPSNTKPSLLEAEGADELLEYTQANHRIHKDWYTHASKRVFYTGGDAFSKFNIARMMADEIQKAKNKYILLDINWKLQMGGQNCNTLVFLCLKSMGEDKPKEPAVGPFGHIISAPGFDFSDSLDEKWYALAKARVDKRIKVIQEIEQLPAPGADQKEVEVKLNGSQQWVRDQFLAAYDYSEEKVLGVFGEEKGRHTLKMVNMVMQAKDMPTTNFDFKSIPVWTEFFDEIGAEIGYVGAHFDIPFLKSMGKGIQSTASFVSTAYGWADKALSLPENFGKTLESLFSGLSATSFTSCFTPLAAIGLVCIVGFGILNKTIKQQHKELRELIIAQMQGLASQISDLRAAMEQNFQQLYRQQEFMFNELMREIQSVKTLIHAEFYNFRIPVMQAFRNLENDLFHLSKRLDRRLDHLYIQQYGRILATIEDYRSATHLTRLQVAQQLLAPSAADNLMSQLAYWLIHESCSDTLNGRIYVLGDLKAADSEREIGRVLSPTATNISNLTGFFAEYTKQILPAEVQREEQIEIQFAAIEVAVKEFMPLYNAANSYSAEILEIKNSIIGLQAPSSIKGYSSALDKIMEYHSALVPEVVKLLISAPKVINQKKKIADIIEKLAGEFEAFALFFQQEGEQKQEAEGSHHRDGKIDSSVRSSNLSSNPVKSIAKDENDKILEFLSLLDVLSKTQNKFTREILILKDYYNEMIQLGNRNKLKKKIEEIESEIKEIKKEINCDEELSIKQMRELLNERKRLLKCIPLDSLSVNLINLKLASISRNVARLLVKMGLLNQRKIDNLQELCAVFKKLVMIKSSAAVTEPEGKCESSSPLLDHKYGPGRSADDEKTEQVVVTTYPAIAVKKAVFIEAVDINQIPNPDVWCNGVLSYLKIRELLLDAGQVYDPGFVQLQKIVTVGSQYIRFVEFVQNSVELFRVLFSRYEEGVADMRASLYTAATATILDTTDSAIEAEKESKLYEVKYDAVQAAMVPEYKEWINGLFRTHNERIIQHHDLTLRRFREERPLLQQLLCGSITTEQAANQLDYPLTTLVNHLAGQDYKEDHLHYRWGGTGNPYPVVDLPWDRADGYSVPWDAKYLFTTPGVVPIPKALLLAERLGLIAFQLKHTLKVPGNFSVGQLNTSLFVHNIRVSVLDLTKNRFQTELLTAEYKTQLPVGAESIENLRRIFDIFKNCGYNLDYRTPIVMTHARYCQLSRAINLILSVNSPPIGVPDIKMGAGAAVLVGQMELKITDHLRLSQVKILQTGMAVDEKALDNLEAFSNNKGAASAPVKTNFDIVRTRYLLLMHYSQFAGFPRDDIEKRLSVVLNPERIITMLKIHLKGLRDGLMAGTLFPLLTEDKTYTTAKAWVLEKISANDDANSLLEPAIFSHDWERQVRTVLHEIVKFLDKANVAAVEASRRKQKAPPLVIQMAELHHQMTQLMQRMQSLQIQLTGHPMVLTSISSSSSNSSSSATPHDFKAPASESRRASLWLSFLPGLAPKPDSEKPAATSNNGCTVS